MSQADVIKEYLVGLGFEVDDDSFAKFKNGLVGAGIIVATIGATVVGLTQQISGFVAKQAKELDSLSDFAGLINEDAAAVEKFEYAATVLDSSAESARASLRGVTEMIGAAAIGMPRALKVFERLGLNFKKNNGEVKTAVELFDDVREAIKDMSRPEQLAFLSRLGIDPTMLRTITEDWSELAAELDKVNAAIGVSKQQAADLGSDYQVASDRLGKIVDSIYKGIAVKLMPRLTRGLDDIRRMLIDNLPMLLDRIVPVLDFVLNVASFGVDLLFDMVDAAGAFVTRLRELNDATGGWAQVILLAYLAWKLWNSEFAQSPTGKVLKLAAAFALLWDDYQGFLKGKQSAINWDGWFGKGLYWALILYGAWTALTSALGAVFGVVWEGAKSFLGLLAIGLAIKTMLGWLDVAAKSYKVAQATVTVGTKAFSAAMWLAEATGSAFGLAMKAVQGVMWLVNAAFAANPVGALIIGVLALGAAAYALYENWDTVKGLFEGLWNWFGSKFDWLAGKLSWVRDAAGSVGDLFDFSGGGSPALVPAPGRAASLRGGNSQTIQSKVDVHVSGAGDPLAVGRAVAREQRDVNSGLVRELTVAQ